MPSHPDAPRGQDAFMPAPTFSTFIISLASAGLSQLGEAKAPGTGATGVDLAAARNAIDTLAMLREKTAGNLNPDEEEVLGALLYELRMKFVLKSR